ncbi:TPA: DUF4160 domain-containing protein [Vibrio parahaemolyticus]|uniref:DUF4160 domain-containing protein n=1 Tax=Vibrio parahaemolyticus TaxID=670 RepID=UPI0009A92546|nr:DUF4160 domain-containing protein [Vibrio parahaemolyticus]MDF5033095.1 DUF4160 domain-containing protein [Vibrio parahaemolyticus]TOF65849.1 DUF4160 domain-containing protein [Vibrio parahaemolyticus]HCE2806899.1 DUF4160 domain-containing protein [Vibrio parahaemolyticus]HCE2891066.1 DUF4160 domain-containing protein [Vibrio parahaemolyticus]HCE2986231.1 DUF4160 domain-containing protein [Vibrio parahaemolyticus]
MKLDEEFRELQELFAQKDMLTERRAQPRNGFIEILLIKRKNMKLKIYQEKGHQRPHIHIDYGKRNHAASYAIETGERLNGDLPKKYDKDVTSWLARNKIKVLAVWEALQLGEPHEGLVAELVGDT